MLRVVAWSSPVPVAVLQFPGLTGLPSVPSWLREGVLGLLFTCLVVRLLIAARVCAERRGELSSLVAGLVLWMVGAAVFDASPAQSRLDFPTPGQEYFLAGFVCVAAWRP